MNRYLCAQFEKFKASTDKQQKTIVSGIKNRVQPSSLWLILMSSKGFTEYKLKCLEPIVDDIVYMISTIDLDEILLLKKFIILMLNKIPQLTVADLELSLKVLNTYESYHDTDREKAIMNILQSILQVIEEIKLIAPKYALDGIDWGLDHGSQFRGRANTFSKVITDSCVLNIRIVRNKGEKYPMVYLDTIKMIPLILDEFEYSDDDEQGGGEMTSIIPNDIVVAQGGERVSYTPNDIVVPQGGGGRNSVNSHEEVVEEDGNEKVSFTSYQEFNAQREDERNSFTSHEEVVAQGGDEIFSLTSHQEFNAQRRDEIVSLIPKVPVVAQGGGNRKVNFEKNV